MPDDYDEVPAGSEKNKVRFYNFENIITISKMVNFIPFLATAKHKQNLSKD